VSAKSYTHKRTCRPRSDRRAATASYRRLLDRPQWLAERRLSVRGQPPAYNIVIIAMVILLWRSCRYHTTAAMMLILLSYYTHSWRRQSTWLVPTYPTLPSACALTWYCCIRGLMKSDLPPHHVWRPSDRVSYQFYCFWDSLELTTAMACRSRRAMYT